MPDTDDNRDGPGRSLPPFQEEALKKELIDLLRSWQEQKSLYTTEMVNILRGAAESIGPVKH